MTIDDDAAYQVLLARDARFDGRLFVGVTSTGIYCRPICRVRTPARRNCRFFDTPAKAEAAAFRPCMKCRPEIAPGPGIAWTTMDASRTLARQAAASLDQIAQTVDRGEVPGVAALAARLGVSDRHLRRIFLAEHGVTPIQYLQTRRLLVAKQLLTDTQMPVAQIALSSGFRSVRRFNAAFAAGYRLAPTRLRKRPARRAAPGTDPIASADAIVVTLAYRPPHDATTLLAFLSDRAIAGVESVDGRVVRRSLRAGAIDAAQPAGWVAARFADDAARVQFAFAPSLGASSAALMAAARRWLDLDASPDAIDAALAELPGPPGLRLPGSLDAFELAVRAVLGQQVTVAGARTLARRLVERFGDTVETPWPDLVRTFPSPEALARATVDAIAGLGIIRSRVGAIQALARAWPELAPLVAPGADPERLVARLVDLPGIGPWTAHYVAMRALGWPDAFPPGDVAALKAMRVRFGDDTHRAALARAERWRPWRAYALLRLWASLASPHADAVPATDSTREAP